MKTKVIDVGSVMGRSSYELAVMSGKFSGTLEEYIDKEMKTYNDTVNYSDNAIATMEDLLSSVTDSSSLDLSELIQARKGYSLLGKRLDATDEQLAIILERLNSIDPSSINLDSIKVTGNNRNVELRNNGVTIQWRIVGELNWIDLINLEDLTPKMSIGKVDITDNPNGAKVTMSGTRRNPVLDFTIPRGKDGKDGASGGAFVDSRINDKGELIVTVRNDSNDMIVTDDDGQKYLIPVLGVGTVETLEHDQPAYVTITGTPTNPKLNFGIPKGKPVKVKGYVGEDGFIVIESE